MAKLTDIRMHACPGSERLFGHVHIGDDNDCGNRRYYKSGNGYLSPTRGSYLTMNEAGGHNHDGQGPFDAIGQLFAAAPRMLALLDALTDDDHLDGSRALALEARALADRLLALDIPAEDHTGFGPYFNEDGTPWQAK